MKSKTHVTGFSLVEMMISIVIGMIILVAATYMTVSGMRAKSDAMRMARLNQGLRSVLLMVSRDLQRAGAWDATQNTQRVGLNLGLRLGAVSGSGITVVPVPSDSGLHDDYKNFNLITATVGGADGGNRLVFLQSSVAYVGTITASSSSALTVNLDGTFPTLDLPAGSWTILSPFRGVIIKALSGGSYVEAAPGSPGTCVAFRYDMIKNGVQGNTEFAGYRFDSVAGTVEGRKSRRDSGTPINCGSVSTAWEPVSDSREIQVTAFSIQETRNSIGSNGLQDVVRTYALQIAGNLRRDSTVSRTINMTVKVRNDDLIFSGGDLDALEAEIDPSS